MSKPITSGSHAFASEQPNVQTGSSHALTSRDLSQTQSSMQSYTSSSSWGVQSFLGTIQNILKRVWNWLANLFGGATTNAASTIVSPEERVRAIFHASEHGNEIVDFEHEGRTFQIRVINNRNGMKVDHIHFSRRYILACADAVPPALVTQLKSLAPEGAKCETYFNIILNGRSIFIAFSSPAERARAIFQANEHRSEVVDFDHDGRTFQIRVINNPHGMKIGPYLPPFLSAVLLRVSREIYFSL